MLDSQTVKGGRSGPWVPRVGGKSPTSRTSADGTVRPDDAAKLDLMYGTEVLDLAEHVAHPPRPARHALREFPSYSLLVRLVAFTGLRAGEVAALRVGRVNPLHGRLQVAESVEEVHGKLV